MKTIEFNGFVFSVDVERTQEYYKTHSLCACGDCRNFYAQSKILSELDDFLKIFGADVSKPDEAMSVEENDRVNYICVDYTICGRIEKMGE